MPHRHALWARSRWRPPPAAWPPRCSTPSSTTRARSTPPVDPQQPHLALAAHELADYFAGRSRHFRCRWTPPGTTFQHRVWQALLGIPHGRTGQLRRASRNGWDNPTRHARWVRRSGATRFRSSCPATAWSGVTARSRAMRAGWRASRRCCSSKALCPETAGRPASTTAAVSPRRPLLQIRATVSGTSTAAPCAVHPAASQVVGDAP